MIYKNYTDQLLDEKTAAESLASWYGLLARTMLLDGVIEIYPDSCEVVICGDPMAWHDESVTFKAEFANGLPVETTELRTAIEKALNPDAPTRPIGQE